MIDGDGSAMAGRAYTRLTRPYALTGGRTRPSDTGLAIEALVEMSWKGYEALADATFERAEILELVRETLSVAELAAHLRIPLGTARVLVSDLADEGLVTIHPPPDSEQGGGGQDPALLEKVLHGLRTL